MEREGSTYSARSVSSVYANKDGGVPSSSQHVAAPFVVGIVLRVRALRGKRQTQGYPDWLPADGYPNSRFLRGEQGDPLARGPACNARSPPSLPPEA